MLQKKSFVFDINEQNNAKCEQNIINSNIHGKIKMKQDVDNKKKENEQCHLLSWMLWHASYFESASKDNKQAHNKLCEKTRKSWTSPKTTQIKKQKEPPWTPQERVKMKPKKG